MTKKKPLEWDEEHGWPLCVECSEHLMTNGYGLMEAFASVGIEHGRSTGDMGRSYFDHYHANGHKLAA